MVVWNWSKVCLATAAATLGAAVIIANSPFALPKRSPFVLQQLQEAMLKRLDGSGKLVRAGDLWKENGAVIMVEATKLSALGPELKTLGVPMYGILHEEEGSEEFKEYLKGDLFYDEKKAFYDSRISFFAVLLRFGVWRNMWKTSRLGIHGNLKGDGLLLGSSLVIGPGDQGIVYQHLSNEVTDIADPDDIMKAARKLRKTIA